MIFTPLIPVLASAGTGRRCVKVNAHVYFNRPCGGAGYKFPRRQVVGIESKESKKVKNIKLPEPKLVKTNSSVFLIYHFPKLNLYVKAKPTIFPSDTQPSHSELCALSPETVEAIENSPFHEVIT